MKPLFLHLTDRDSKNKVYVNVAQILYFEPARLGLGTFIALSYAGPSHASDTGFFDGIVVSECVSDILSALPST